MGSGTYVEEGMVDNPEQDNILEEGALAEGIHRTPVEAVGVDNTRFCSSRHRLEQLFSN